MLLLHTGMFVFCVFLDQYCVTPKPGGWGLYWLWLWLLHGCCDRGWLIINLRSSPCYRMYSTWLSISLVSKVLFCSILQHNYIIVPSYTPPPQTHTHTHATVHTRTVAAVLLACLHRGLISGSQSQIWYWMLSLSSHYLLQCLHPQEISPRFSLPQWQDRTVKMSSSHCSCAHSNPFHVSWLKLPLQCELLLAYYMFKQEGTGVEENSEWSFRE